MLCLVDIETTGLDPRRDAILELGMLIVGDDLQERAAFNRVVTTPWETLVGMPQIVQDMHEHSGLLHDVRSGMAMPAIDVYAHALAWLRSEIPKEEIPMVGNSIHFDRIFLKLQMPDVEDYFHYRSIDISSIREAAHRWAPNVNENVLAPNRRHRAADDLRDSLELLRFYKTHLFEKVSP